MQIIDFFNLERSLQDRFVEAANGSVPPTPLAFSRARLRPLVLAWWAGCVVSAVLALACLAMGFGELESGFAILSLPWAFVIALFIALAVFCALRALAIDHDRDSLPYRAGAYVFPIGVVDAQSEVVRVYRFPELTEVQRREKRVTLSFEGGARFDFDTADVALAEQLVQLVEQNRQRVSGPSGPPSSRELAGLDPLAETGFRSPFTPSEPRRKSSPRWLRFGWLEAILIGAVLGPAAWYARNFVSEERLYTAARSLGTIEGFRAYLARGGARPDVKDVLLPQAELQRAIGQGSVAALEDFMTRAPHRQIRAQVQAALKKALQAELAQVAAKNSLTELVAFERAQKHPELIRAEVEVKKQELFQKAARAFAAVAQPSTPGLVGFFGRLLFYAQKNGPEVEVAFRRRATDPNDAEAALQKSAYYLGPESMPSRFFRPEDWEAREKDVGEAIAARLSKEFSPDILRFKFAPVMADDGSDFPKVSRPTLVITHRAELSGAFMSKKPRGVFVGLGLTVRSAFIIPGDEQPLNFKFSAWLSPDMKVWEAVGAKPKDVYEALAREGLSRYEKKQLAYFFKVP
jgi:hypothetical protein